MPWDANGEAQPDIPVVSILGRLAQQIERSSCRRPPQTENREPAEWLHGWQYWPSSVFDAYRRKNSMTNRPSCRQAHLRSHSGRNAGVVFSHAPIAAACTVPPHLFRVLLLERLQLPLPLTQTTCNGCHERLDSLGRHRGACTRSGRVKKRASPTERMFARVCREARARVKFNAYLRDMNLGVRGWHRICLASTVLNWQSTSPCGALSVLPVRPNLEPRRRAGSPREGSTYPELLTSRRCRLVVVAIETGGRWSDEAAELLWQLALAKAR